MVIGEAGSFLVVGDFCLAGSNIADDVTRRHFWAGVEEVTSGQTCIIANLECAITDRGTPRPYKWANLRASPRLRHALQGLDVAILGNNHISDFGLEGAEDTLEILKEQGIAHAGYGNTIDDAIAPAMLEKHGVRIAIVSLCCPTTNGENIATYTSEGVAPLGAGLLQRAVAATVVEARATAAAVLVYLHWGIEREHNPVPDQLRLARVAIDAGADAVVGCHAHVIQSFEQYHGRWIFYGLGNFLFDAVEILEPLGNGTFRKGAIQLKKENKQSLAVEFSYHPDSTSGRLRLKQIHCLEFGDDFVPKPISSKSLTVNLGAINDNLSRYVSWNTAELKSVHEPRYEAVVRNGTITYFYTTRPISGALVRRFGSRARQYVRRLDRILVR